MILDFLLYLTAGLVIGLILILANNAVKCRLALNKLGKHLKHVKIADGIGIFGNHMLELGFGYNCKFVHESHAKHGEYVAILLGTDISLSTLNLDLIKRLAVDNSNKNINRLQFKLPMKEFEHNCIVLAADDQWRGIRRAFAPVLKAQKLREYNVMGDIELTIEKMLSGIENRLNLEEQKSFNIDNLMHRCSLDIVLRSLYKQRDAANFDLDEKCKWVEVVEDGLRDVKGNPLIGWGMIVPPIRRIVDFVSYQFHRSGKWRREVLKFLKIQARVSLEAGKQLEEMRQKGIKVPNEDDFILKDGTRFRRAVTDQIVDQLHSSKISKEEFLNSSLFLFNAADKTLADALSFTMYQLSKHQKVQEKLRLSIAKHGTESEYLSWVINESLRLEPPVPGGCSRIITDSFELDNGDVFPPGTFLVTPLYTIHRYKKYWGEDADEFRPERFREADKFHPCQYMPFGVGLRKCLGKNFALLEMKMVICAIVNRYRIFPPTDRVNDEERKLISPLFIFLLHDEPTYVRISRV